MKAKQNTNRITTNLSDQQKESLLKICGASSKTPGRFIREDLIIPLIEDENFEPSFEVPLHVNFPEPSQELLGHLRNMGNNLNQLMRTIHETRKANNGELDKAYLIREFDTKLMDVKELTETAKQVAELFMFENSYDWFSDLAMKTLDISCLQKILDKKLQMELEEALK